MIRALPRAVVERIAAGEVIERPASVVKELLENALDAGATDVQVNVEQGGLLLVRVADDGGGIDAADLPLALATHATSKLHDVDDLFHIASFGFRGEALASIAAVSRLVLTSRTADAAAGSRLAAEAGRSGPVAPAACARGTVVEVRDLFFNTPARRPFLGAVATEAARCREVCAAVSLVNPGVRIRFQSDGRLRFTADGSPALRDRVAAVYDDAFVEELVPVTGRAPGLEVEGLLSLPAAARPRPRCQHVFVNQRPVRDRAIVAAVRSACRDFLPSSLQPSFVLCLTIDPAGVDVNVHPTKAEVRFRDADAVFRLLRGASREALLAVDLAPRVRAEHMHGQRALTSAPATGWLRPPASDGAAAATAPAVPEAVAEAAGAGSGSAGLAPAGGRAPAVPAAPLLRPAGRFLQVLGTYIAHDSPDGLVLIDQHALHERVLYARLQADLAAGRLESQRLLLPETVRLPPVLHERALALAPELQRLGLSVASFGPDTLAVHALPAVLRGEPLADLLTALVDPPELHGGIPTGLDRRLFTMACHAAVKAGDVLDEEEIAALLAQGEALEHDATCPHGRPTRLLVGRAELERLFKRTGF